MSRRATGLIGLTALLFAIIVVIAMTADPKTGLSAEPTSEPDSSTRAPVTRTVDPAVRSRAEARMAQKAARVARTNRLFGRFGCWTGDAPAGAVPTHALVTLPGKPPALVSADVGFGIWLDDDPGQLHGFCP